MNQTQDVSAKILAYLHSTNTEERSLFLEDILTKLRPMLLARCRYYFGYFTEDLVQQGYVRLIELIDAYDECRTEVPVLGYLNRMMACYYFSLNRKLRKEKERNFSLEEEVLENIRDDAEEERVFQNDVQELLKVLNEREYILIREHILRHKTLKSVCEKMNISYTYGKKIKQTSLRKMKSVLNK